MNPNYLTGLQYKHCGEWDTKLTGLYALKGGNNAYYYISTYNAFKNKKQYFFDILQKHQKEVKKDWELHHIVEKQHLTHFYTQGQLSHLYNKVWPCILIHKTEHHTYNSLLHNKAAKVLFTANSSSKSQLLSNIKTMYQQAYLGNHMLSTIAKNVLRTVKV